MLYSALAFLAGICAFQYCAELPAAGGWWLLAGATLALSPLPWLRAAGIAAAGFLWVWWHASQIAGVQLPAELEGGDVLVEGLVQGLPERLDDGRVRFRFLIEQYAENGHWQPLELTARMTWYRQAEVVRAGERWQLLVRLKQPHGLSNPGGFDYERWLFAQGIRATGYIRGSRLNRRTVMANRYSVAGLRQRLSAHLQELQVAPSMRALLRGLGVGDRSGMSADQWQVLQRTGTSHLLAISGLHVGLVAGLVFFIARKGWSILGKPLRWPAPRVAALCSMFAALAYAMLAGFQVPAQRALVMVCVWMLAILCCSRPVPWRVWSLALWMILLLDPLSVLSAGFWLSFAAVALILLLTAGRSGGHSRRRRLLSVQFGLIFGLTPLLWSWFQQVSLSAPIANLVAIPWVGFLVIPLLLAGLLCLPFLPLLGDCLIGLSADLLSILWWLLEQLAALPVNLWQSPAVSGVWMLLFTLGVVAALLPRALSLLPVSILLMLAVLRLEPARPDSGDLWFSLLDVGQGLAGVVETRHHVLLYDAGPAFRSGLNSGESVIAPFLVQRGYRHVDRMVISHSDNDHLGGAEAVFERLGVFSIESGEPGAIGWARATWCRSGHQWVWDGVQFEYLAPFDREEGNNGSCVLRVEAADGRVLLLPGDIESRIERQLLRQGDRQLAADILVAPHHGSRTSSSAEFVKAVKPAYVLFPVGYRNRFGFPRPEVEERYRAIGARMLDSAGSGAIQLRVEAGKPLQAVAYRQQSKRYWRTKP
ncbi:MAG: DNA internalization-related competence protein ComEC/Rec2 [Thiogranum sp.]